jgi:elongation factor Ts
MKITAQMVKELRDATGAGILDAKKALEAAGGDADKATAILREKGLKRVEKKSGRQANEGLIEMYSHPGNRVGVILEINCETDFVARNEAFQALAHNIALQIAAMNPRYVGQADVPSADMEAEREALTKMALTEGKPEHIVAKIVDGRMRKFYEEYCLLDQPFVMDESKTIQDLVNDNISTLGENIVVRRFQRYELGDSE